MSKFISNLFLGALAILLSIFTASRTLDLLAWALPANQVIYQWLGLCAYEGGMYFWSFYFVSGAKGVPQRSISLCMAVFSVVAVMVATIADLSLGASEAGKIAALPASMQQAMIVFVGVTIALNVAAFLACKLMSPEKLREIKAGQAEDMIFGEGLRAIEAIAPTMAAEAAPYLAAEWSNRTWQRIVPGVPRQTYVLPPAGSSPEAPALPAPALPAPALPASASTPAPAPAPVPSQAPTPRRRGRFLSWLAGKDAPQASASFSQTADASEVPATPKAPAAPAHRVPDHVAFSYNRVRPRYPHIAAARRAARSQRHHSTGRIVAPAPAEPTAAQVERRTCSECPTVFEVQRNAKKLTCSPACRQARSRRLAAAKRGQAHKA